MSQRTPAPGRSPTRGLALLLSLLIVPALAACGGESSGDGEGEAGAADTAAAGSALGAGSASMQQYQQVAQQLNTIRQQAMQDSALQAEEAELRAAIQDQMEEDPRTAALLARFDSVRQEFETARSSGDSTAMQQLMPQLQQMQMQLRQAQGQAAQDPGIAAQIDTFRSHLEDEMAAVDPQAPQMLERADSLAQQVRSEMGSAAESAAAGQDTSSGGS